MSGWRVFDAATLEREYSPSSCIGGDYAPFVRAYRERSAAARAAVPGRIGLRYGPGAAHTLDLFVPSRSEAPPLLVFIHGGYWQELSKADSSFAAIDCMREGIALAVPDYALAPAATLEQIVGECSDALAWLRANAGALGFDAERIVVAGSSAGAHLAAMSARHCAATVLLSGVYELEPLVGTTINVALGLDAPRARALSPALGALDGFPPALVAWGEHETREFKRQSRDFAARLPSAQTLEVAGRNHFDIVFDLADAATPLGAAVLSMLSMLTSAAAPRPAASPRPRSLRAPPSA